MPGLWLISMAHTLLSVPLGGMYRSRHEIAAALRGFMASVSSIYDKSANTTLQCRHRAIDGYLFGGEGAEQTNIVLENGHKFGVGSEDKGRDSSSTNDTTVNW